MKVLVVDDHPLVRDALRGHLQTLEVGAEVLEARSGTEALQLVDRHPDLDLLLLDLSLPGMNGFSTLTVVRERHPEIPVAVLSATQDRETVLNALDRGAMGFIPKSSAVPVMLSALRLVLSGGVYLPPELLGPSAAPLDSLGPAPTPADLGLSERQAQVLALIIQGKPNKIISRELGLAESTVKTHVTAILRALKVANRTQAVLAVGRIGMRLDGVGPEKSE
jgi:DNA-binding NarL/FixJ family response regulator